MTLVVVTAAIVVGLLFHFTKPKELTTTCPCISGSANLNEFKIPGPISIGRNQFVSELDYSDNFEASFEFKASTVPSGSTWQQIILGSLIILMLTYTKMFFRDLYG